MPWILRKSLSEDITIEEVKERYRRYFDYLASVRPQLPDATYAFATADWHYADDPRAPHGAWLEDVAIHIPSLGKRSEIRGCNIDVRLLGAYHDGYIELHYRDVYTYSLVSASEWQVDEIRLTRGGRIVHEIVFDAGIRWKIECYEITYEWKPFLWEKTIATESGMPILMQPRKLATHEIWVGEVAFSPDGNLLGEVSRGVLSLWEVSSGSLLQEWGSDKNWITHIAFSPGGNTLAGFTSYKDVQVVQLWDVTTGQQIGMLKTGRKDNDWNVIQQIAFSPDGALLASAAREDTKLYKVKPGSLLRTFESTGSVSFNANGSILAGISSGGRGSFDNGAIVLWNALAGQEEARLVGRSMDIFKVAFNPSGTKVASIGRDYVGPPTTIRLITIWDALTSKEFQELRTTYDIADIAWHPEGRLLASAGGPNPGAGGDETGWITVWDAQTGRALQTLAAHAKAVDSIAFSPDGKLLASGSSDGSIKLWTVHATHEAMA